MRTKAAARLACASYAIVVGAIGGVLSYMNLAAPTLELLSWLVFPFTPIARYGGGLLAIAFGSAFTPPVDILVTSTVYGLVLGACAFGQALVVLAVVRWWRRHRKAGR